MSCNARSRSNVPEPCGRSLAIAAAAILAGAEAQVGPYTAGGGQPGNLRAWRSDRANETTHGFFRNTLRTLERAWIRPRVLGWPDLQLALSHLVRDAVVARRFDETTLDRIERLPATHLTEEIEWPISRSMSWGPPGRATDAR